MTQESGQTKQIGLHLSWNKSKMDLSGVQKTFMKISFRLGPNASQARPGEIKKFWLMQTSTLVVLSQVIKLS
jgi:hypothetical protein